jgi:hypothetical protein
VPCIRWPTLASGRDVGGSAQWCARYTTGNEDGRITGRRVGCHGCSQSRLAPTKRKRSPPGWRHRPMPTPLATRKASRHMAGVPSSRSPVVPSCLQAVTASCDADVRAARFPLWPPNREDAYPPSPPDTMAATYRNGYRRTNACGCAAVPQRTGKPGRRENVLLGHLSGLSASSAQGWFRIHFRNRP